MKNIFSFKLIILLFLAIVCVSCANSPLAPAADDAKAKRFEVTNGKANIYIYRDEDVVLNTPVSLFLNGEAVGETGAKTYILKTVEPGTYKIKADGENTAEIEVNAQANKNTFVWLEISLGVFTNRAHLHQVDDKKGKQGVRTSHLIK